jgi:hypothetical protein
VKTLCICGKKRSGKDTVAAMVKSLYPSISYGLAYPVKVALAAGFSGIKTNQGYLDYDAFDGTNENIDREAILDIDFNVVIKSISMGFKVIGRDLQDELGAKAVSELMRGLSVEYNKNDGFSMRQLMQIVGTDIGCNVLGKDIWLNFMLDVWLKSLQKGIYEYFIVTDCRQSHEIQMFRAMQANILHVNRTCINSTDTHITEVGIEPLKNEQIIENSTTLDDLYESVKQSIYRN